MRRLTLLALAVLLSLTACATDPAVRDAHDRADRVADLLKGVDPWVSEEVGYRLTQEANVAVFDVWGDGPGVPGRVRIGVRGIDRDFTPEGFTPGSPASERSTPAAEVFLCFEVEVTYRSKQDRSRAGLRDRWTDVTEVDCPEGRPRSFRPPAALPAGTLERLKERLPTILDLEAARRAVRGLDLDPRIRQDVAVVGDRIGIALKEPDGDCLLARVWPYLVQVWSPWRWTPPVVPAERACSAAQAASGYTNWPSRGCRALPAAPVTVAGCDPLTW